jgi:CHAD domain-containing protein
LDNTTLDIVEPIFPEMSARPAHLCELALALFDQTRQLHALTEVERLVLEQAALLSAVRASLTKKKPYQTALELVKAQPGLELLPEQQKSLAVVLAVWQGKLGLKELKHLRLTTVQQRAALTLAAILHMADGLNSSGNTETTIQTVEPSESGMWISVDGPNAAADAAEAQRRIRPWEKLGYPAVELLESSEAAKRRLPFPAPADCIGIQPKESLAEAGRKVMSYHFAQMLRHEDGTRLGEDIEALHDMRVATRRLRAAFEVFNDAFEPQLMKPYLKGLRATGRALGSVRDLDVFMEKAQRYIDNLPEGERGGLVPLLGQWQGQREEARTRMLEHLNSWEYASFKQKFNLFLHTPGMGACPQPLDQPAPDRVCELAPVLIYSRIAAARAYAPWLTDAPVERLHMLRIEFKKLRYTVEYFAEVLGKRSFEVINALKQIQDHLGDLNDAQVATQIIGDFIEGWDVQQQALPIQERQNIEGVVNYLAARHAERYQLQITFQAAWDTHFNNKSFRRYLAQAISVL